MWWFNYCRSRREESKRSLEERSSDCNTFIVQVEVCDGLIIAEADVLIDIEFSGESDFEITLERRISRGFQTAFPDDYHEKPTIDRVHFTCSYLEEIVWPEMLKHPEYRRPKG